MEAQKTFVGCTVIASCGKGATYRGVVKFVDVKHHGITLSEVSLNSVRLPVSELALSAAEITDLKILQMTKERKKEQSSSIVDDIDATKKKKGFSSPREQRVSKSSESGKKSQMKQKHAARDEQCFGNAAHCPSLPDFDFEKNLALFDKETVFEKLKQDMVVLPEPLNANCSEKKMKPHENVLEKEPVSLRQIKVPAEHVGKEYTTDNGLVVPATSLHLRQQLMKAAMHAGLSMHQMNETAALCTCLMALQLVGGNSRVCPKNSHQNVEIVILAGPHTQGVQAVSAARHLANHTANVKVFIPDLNPLLPAVELFTKTGGKAVHRIRDLPQYPVDLIMDAMIGHDEPNASYDWLNAAIHWANDNKAPVLSLDPCRHAPLKEEIDIKWSVAMALPLINSPRTGRLYVADIGIPRGIFKDVGIMYHSPFLDKFFAALYD